MSGWSGLSLPVWRRRPWPWPGGWASAWGLWVVVGSQAQCWGSAWCWPWLAWFLWQASLWGTCIAAVGGRQLPLHALGEEPSLPCWAPEPPGLGRRPRSTWWPGIGACLPFRSDSFPQVHLPPTPMCPAAAPADRHRRAGWAAPWSRAGRAQGRACVTATLRVCAVTCCGRRCAGRWHCKRGAGQERCLPAPLPPNPRRPCIAFGCVPRV